MKQSPASIGSFALASMLATVARAQPIVMAGEGTCPSIDMIRAALPAARPEGTWPQEAVTVEVAGDRLVVSLGEAPTVRRDIPADADCFVRAQSVAVVIATWAGKLLSHPTESPVVAPAPAPPVAASPASVLAASPVPAPTPVERPGHVIELDGGAFYSPLWGHAPGAWLGVGRTPRAGGLGARVLGAYQPARDVVLEAGTNQVLRFVVGAALTYHLQRRYVFASGDAGLVGTLTRAQGTGYETNRADSATNFGGLADLRGGLHLGRARLWMNARVLALAWAETVKIQSTSPGVADHAGLGRWDLQLGVGLGFRFE